VPVSDKENNQTFKESTKSTSPNCAKGIPTILAKTLVFSKFGYFPRKQRPNSLATSQNSVLAIPKFSLGRHGERASLAIRRFLHATHDPLPSFLHAFLLCLACYLNLPRPVILLVAPPPPPPRSAPKSPSPSPSIKQCSRHVNSRSSCEHAQQDPHVQAIASL
jgi:hypothetical protein